MEHGFDSADPPVTRWIRRWRERRQERRENGCYRCARPASGACAACGVNVCSACQVASIETGNPTTLCVTCAAPRSKRPKIDPRAAFRVGARLLGLTIAIWLALAWQSGGWPMLRAGLAALTNPALLIGLAPLACILGFAVIWLRSALAAWIESEPPP